MTNRPVAITTFPENYDRASRLRFLRELDALVDAPGRPRVILDLSSVRKLSPEAIDALVECVERVERADSELTVVGASPQTEVILELTQLTSIMTMLPSLAEAGNKFQVHEVATAALASIPLHAA